MKIAKSKCNLNYKAFILFLGKLGKKNSEIQKQYEERILNAKLFEIHDKIFKEELEYNKDVYRQYYTLTENKEPTHNNRYYSLNEMFNGD